MNDFTAFCVSIVLTLLLLPLVNSVLPKPKIEEELQIEAVEHLSQCPTYYVDKIETSEAEVYNITLHRDSNRADGTLPEKLTVTFYKKYTPSVQYLRKNDSIKADLYELREEKRIDGRYVTSVTYEANLFVFVDQIPALSQKYKAMRSE